MSATDELLRNNERYAEGFDKDDLPIPPAKGIAVVTCMDARLSPYVMLGLGGCRSWGYAYCSERRLREAVNLLWSGLCHEWRTSGTRIAIL